MTGVRGGRDVERRVGPVGEGNRLVGRPVGVVGLVGVADPHAHAVSVKAGVVGQAVDRGVGDQRGVIVGEHGAVLLDEVEQVGHQLQVRRDVGVVPEEVHVVEGEFDHVGHAVAQRVAAGRHTKAALVAVAEAWPAVATAGSPRSDVAAVMAIGSRPNRPSTRMLSPNRRSFENMKMTVSVGGYLRRPHLKPRRTLRVLSTASVAFVLASGDRGDGRQGPAVGEGLLPEALEGGGVTVGRRGHIAGRYSRC